MEKIILICMPLLLIACGDSDGNGNTNNEPLDPIIGTWVLVNEEIVGGDWGNSCRGCFMENDAGSPDTFVFT